MNRKELINALASQTGSTKAAAGRHVSALIEIISDNLNKGDKIALAGFGTFAVRERAARIGRNPMSGTSVQIKAARVPVFKAADNLKATLNNGKK